MKHIKNTYKVYIHIFPNDKVYVGITSRSTKKRWGNNGIGYKDQALIYRAIEKYGWDNIEHVILHDNLTEKDAKEKEMYYIKKYNSNNPNFGYNLTDGGDGTKGYYPSEKTRQKMSESRKGEKNPNYKKQMSDTQKKILSEYAKSRTGSKNPFYGRNHSEETKRKISETKRKQKLKGSKTHNSKRVRCIELDKYFESAAEAARWVGASTSTITNACRSGSDFLSFGYHWEYI